MGGELSPIVWIRELCLIWIPSMERDMLLLSQEKVATLLRLPILGTCISLPMEGTPEWAESYPLLCGSENFVSRGVKES